MSASAADPYATFLTSAEVPTWRDCLGRLAEAVAGPGGADLDRLAQALCVAAYLEWLGRVSGDPAAEAEASERYAALVSVLRRESATVPASELRTCWGIVLGYAGYKHRPETLLAHDGRPAAEHLTLIARSGDVRLLAKLRTEFAGPGRRRFLPALNLYAGELADAGRVNEAREVVTADGWEATQPLVVDILGVTSEQLGRWAEAHEAYQSSPWPAHRYRAAITGAIVGRPGVELALDEPTRRLLAGLSEELSQREMPGRVAFLNACLWQPVDDWVVHRELGELGFRRRRFAEADFDLARAERTAPDGARFAIAVLRFVNLTWLTGPGLALDLSMVPEALTAARGALAVSLDTDDTKDVRIWVARERGDYGLIPTDLGSWDPYRRGEAHELLGDAARAIDSWFLSLRQSYYHRAAWNLIRYVADAGLARAATHLARIVLEESSEDFFALWETAKSVNEIAARVGSEGHPGEELDQVEEQYWERLVQLSRLEFKNGIRLIELAAQYGLRDLVEESFPQVARQAEGVSELVAVAVLRRRVTGWPTNQVQREVRWCLARALREARDRLERLEIARELFHCGQHSDAHAILTADRVLAPETPLSHAEMVVALQCSAWLTSAECAALAGRAARQLKLDRLSGALGPDPDAYEDRLYAAVEDESLSRLIEDKLADLPPPVSYADRDTRSDDAWPAVRSALEEAFYAGEDLVAWLRARLGPDGSGGSLGLRLMICAHLRQLMDRLHKEARAMRPTVPADEAPLAHGADDNELVIALCDAWRARLSRPEPEAHRAAAQLRDLYDTDRVRMQRWEGARRDVAEPMWLGVARAGEALLVALEWLIGPAERAEVHPVLVEVYARVATDVTVLSADVAQQIHLARSGEADLASFLVLGPL